MIVPSTLLPQPAGMASPLNQGWSSNDNSAPASAVKPQLLAGFDADFRRIGYSQLDGLMPTQRQFDALYTLFEQIVFGKFAEHHGLDQLHDEAKEWLANSANRRGYAGAPMGFRDRRPREDKADKVYFQFCPEFYYYLRANRSSCYYRHPHLANLLDELADCSKIAEGIFNSLLFRLDTRLRRTLLGPDGTLSVLLKILAYEPSVKWGTTPHFDKAAFALVMNADDVATESFRIAPYRDGISKLELQAPDRRAPVDEPGTAILFPGMCLRAVGVGDILPSPHGVEPVQGNRRRHSVIAFLITPDVDTSGMDTDSFNDLSSAYR